jgi:hypothetical protein
VLRRGDRVEPVADAQVPEDLDGALVDDVRARRVGRAPVPFDDQMSPPYRDRATDKASPAGPAPTISTGTSTASEPGIDMAASASGHHPPGDAGLLRAS